MHAPFFVEGTWITALVSTIILYSPGIHPIPKQEAHGPDLSPENTDQIDNHIWLHVYHNVDLEKKKPIIYFMKIECFFIWTNLNPLHPKMLCAMFE